MLQANTNAPSFTSINQKNETINLSDFNGNKNVVLYFYPKDDTPGCTIEANQFTDLVDEFTKLNTIIFGVSKDDTESHQAFIDKFNLKIDLLADTDGSLCDTYGVWQEKEKNGVKKMGIVRSTFIIDQSGKLADVEYGVAAEGHAQLVLDKIRKL
ncbi:MAG: peroxiredoxin [Gammaproteobacteria bacterium]|nr:peroxiredoxin [Gammaproteobacteria bacterium]